MPHKVLTQSACRLGCASEKSPRRSGCKRQKVKPRMRIYTRRILAIVVSGVALLALFLGAPSAALGGADQDSVRQADFGHGHTPQQATSDIPSDPTDSCA